MQIVSGEFALAWSHSYTYAERSEPATLRHRTKSLNRSVIGEFAAVGGRKYATHALLSTTEGAWPPPGAEHYNGPE